MSRLKAKSLVLSPWKNFLGMLCVALVLITGTLSVTHSHPNNVDEHGTCALCISAHMAVQATAPAPQVTVSLIFIDIEQATPVARPQSVPHFALFSRPPPVSTQIA